VAIDKLLLFGADRNNDFLHGLDVYGPRRGNPSVLLDERRHQGSDSLRFYGNLGFVVTSNEILDAIDRLIAQVAGFVLVPLRPVHFVYMSRLPHSPQ
jgi:hypothetical protein